MKNTPWARLPPPEPPPPPGRWLEALLGRNARCEYLLRHGSPRTLDAFRATVPIVTYDEVAPWIEGLESAETNVLFAGRPVAYEQTAGSSGARKRIPYSRDGLADFRHSILPWLHGLVHRYSITGSAYFSISPVTRASRSIGGIPVGLPDGAYLGSDGARILAEVTAVPFEVATVADVDRWRTQTLAHLEACRDLELISVWSPTFLLELLDDLPDPRSMWPRLKVVSCWASAASAPFARELASRLPHAHLQPKGLISTEAAITIPDGRDCPVLTAYGFFEFERDESVCRADEVQAGGTYEVIATTASGLYRYRTGDHVRCNEVSAHGAPVLEFVGRGNLVCDLVGEKLSEPFAARCLAGLRGFHFLVPDTDGRGYVLAADSGQDVDWRSVETRLCENPQYAYARRLGQLRALRLCQVDRLMARYTAVQVARDTRIGDVKPFALRNERFWVTSLGLEAFP